MTCDRCKKNETDVHNVVITCNAWQPTRKLCSNCVGWLQTYFNKFMENDFDFNAAIQTPLEKHNANVTAAIRLVDSQRRLIEVATLFYKERKAVIDWTIEQARKGNLVQNDQCPTWWTYEMAQRALFACVDAVGKESE